MDTHTKSGHTPGPWKVTNGWPTAVWIHAARGGCTIAQIESENCDNAESALADARLIAAAPEMLALIQDCQEAFEQEFQGEPRLMFLLNKARTLLARIEGEHS